MKFSREIDLMTRRNPQRIYTTVISGKTKYRGGISGVESQCANDDPERWFSST